MPCWHYPPEIVDTHLTTNWLPVPLQTRHSLPFCFCFSLLLPLFFPICFCLSVCKSVFMCLFVFSLCESTLSPCEHEASGSLGFCPESENTIYSRDIYLCRGQGLKILWHVVQFPGVTKDDLSFKGLSEWPAKGKILRGCEWKTGL